MTKKKMMLALICITLLCCLNTRVEAHTSTLIKMVIEAEYPGAVISDKACVGHPNKRDWKLCYVAFTHKSVFYIAQVNVDCRYGDCNIAELFDVISKKDF